jgi:hypothetical protein
MKNTPPFSVMATFGHSGSHAEQPVHWDAMIFNGMSLSLRSQKMKIPSHAAMNAP